MHVSDERVVSVCEYGVVEVQLNTVNEHTHRTLSLTTVVSLTSISCSYSSSRRLRLVG